MPFDTPDKTGIQNQARAERDRRLVATWLFVTCFMILLMVVLGGVTRLTGSGLSIMEWDPLMGTLPPLSHHEWERLYRLYQQIPQYTLVNQGFGLDGFKRIFWLEWTHRLWGRLIGLEFFVPLVWFWATGRIERRLRPRLGIIFLLGGLQGFVGWFMVASGFMPNSTAVEPARLVVHLVMALLLYAAILWTGLSVLNLTYRRSTSGSLACVRRLAVACLVLVSVTIVAGGFTAGLHAGLTYNTFPLMDGHLIPKGYAQLDPLLLNFTQNVAAVQFNHRLLATLTALTVLATVVVGLRAGAPSGPMIGLGAAVLAQYSLGVATLLAVVPVDLAAAHQGVAVLLLSAVLITLHSLRAPSVFAVSAFPQPSQEPV
jgi:cytochrome c oxidase assembly protein subunit 15